MKVGSQCKEVKVHLTWANRLVMFPPLQSNQHPCILSVFEKGVNRHA
jgi:hypothetical protein